jgi:hypothetical protein
VVASHSKRWIRAALLVGVVYLFIGRVTILPAANIPAWRLAAWLISGVAYTAHIWYEHFRLLNPPRVAAVHVAVAVAIGGFGLAVAGMIHSLSTAAGFRPAWLLALVLWPAVTGVPAFLGAVVALSVLSYYARPPETS